MLIFSSQSQRYGWHEVQKGLTKLRITLSRPPGIVLGMHHSTREAVRSMHLRIETGCQDGEVDGLGVEQETCKVFYEFGTPMVHVTESKETSQFEPTLLSMRQSSGRLL